MRFIIANEFYQQMLADAGAHAGLLRPAGRVPAPHVHRRREVRHRPGGARLPGAGRGKGRPGSDRAPAAAQAALRTACSRTRSAPGTLTDGVTLLGDPPPTDEEAVPTSGNPYAPRLPTRWEDLGLDLPFLFDLMLRTIYTRGQITGGELANEMAHPVRGPEPGLPGDAQANADRHRRPARRQRRRRLRLRNQAAQGHRRRSQDALDKTTYVGPAPVPFADYVEVGARPDASRSSSSRGGASSKAFEDLIITDDVFNEIGPAINSAHVDLLLRLPRQRQDEHRRAHHPADGRRDLRPVRRRGERPDHQGVRPDPAHDRSPRSETHGRRRETVLQARRQRSTSGSSASSGRRSSSAAN